MTTTQNLFGPNFKHVPSEPFRGGPQVSVSLWVTGDRDSGHLRLLPLKPILKSYNAPFESVLSPDSPNTWLWKLLNCCVCVISGRKGDLSTPASHRTLFKGVVRYRANQPAGKHLEMDAC